LSTSTKPSKTIRINPNLSRLIQDRKNRKRISLRPLKKPAKEDVELSTPNSGLPTPTARPVATPWERPLLTSTEEKLMPSNPVKIVAEKAANDGLDGIQTKTIESPQIPESQSPAEINAPPLVVYTPEQSTIIINDLAMKLASTEAKLNEALGAASTIQQAAPTTMGGKAMAFLNSPVLATIADGITKMLQAPAGDPILEQIKNQLLMQKLGILLPATPEKVVVQ